MWDLGIVPNLGPDSNLLSFYNHFISLNDVLDHACSKQLPIFNAAAYSRATASSDSHKSRVEDIQHLLIKIYAWGCIGSCSPKLLVIPLVHLQDEFPLIYS